jgi:hypothetical protein
MLQSGNNNEKERRESIQTGYEVYPSSCPMDTTGSCLEEKAVGA